MRTIPSQFFLNRVQLLGYAVRKPILRQRRDGSGLSLHFRLATHEYSIIDKGERRDIIQWHDVSVWPQVFVERAKNIRPGWRIFVEGHLRTIWWVHEERRVSRTQVYITTDGMLLLLKRTRARDIEEDAALLRDEENPTAGLPPRWVPAIASAAAEDEE